MHLIISLTAIFGYLFTKIYNNFNRDLSSKQYIIFTIILILIVGLRGVGVDNDYSTYESSIYNNLSIGEPTFLLITFIIRTLGLPNYTLFLVYAAIGISLKMRIIYKYSYLPIISFIIYLSNIIMLQDINQIRAGVATALFLTSIPYLVQNKKKIFTYIILLATLFHFSSFLLLVLLFIDATPLSKNKYIFWGILPLLGYIFYFAFNFINVEHIPIAPVREKLIMYKTLQEMGSEGFSNINLFNPYFVFKLLIYYLLFHFYVSLRHKDERITLYLKIFAISLCIFPTLGAITPILGYRSSDLFGSIEILLFPYLFILFKGKRIKGLCTACYFILLFSINLFYKHLIYF